MNKVQLNPIYVPNTARSSAIANGYIYVGTVDLDPEIVGNQIQMSVQQEDGTVVNVAQPLRTDSGGVPEYNGSPVTILVDGNYSLKILDSEENQVFYVPSDVTITTSVTKRLSVDYSCDLDAAITDIGATPTTLYIDCSATIAALDVLTVPTTLETIFVDEGFITGTGTVNWNGFIQAGANQIFDTGVTLDFTNNINDFFKISWFETIAHAVSVFSSKAVDLIFDSTQNLTGDLTITDNINLIMANGFTLGGAFTLTLEGKIEAGRYQIFDFSIMFSGLGMSYPEWWGVDGTDDDIEIQAACDNSKHVKLSGTTYVLSSTVTVNSGQRISGESTSSTIISSPGITAFKTAAASNVLIEDMTIDSDDTATTYGIWLYRCTRSSVRNVTITDFGTANDGAGIFIDGDGANGSWGIELNTLDISSCGRGVYAFDAQAITCLNVISRLNVGYAGHFNDIYGLSIIGGAFEYSDSANSPNGWNLVLDTVRHAFVQSFFENARDGHVWIKDSKLCTITNSRISSYSGSSMAFGWVYLNNSNNCTISNCDLNAGLDGTFTNKAQIYIDATSNFNRIENNDIEADGNIGNNYHIVNLGASNQIINNRGHQNADANIGPCRTLWGTATVQIAGVTNGIIGTFVDGDISPDIGWDMNAVWTTANTGVTTIIDLDRAGSGGLDINGQRVTIIFGDTLTTISHAQKFYLNGTAPFTGQVGDTLSVVHKDGFWHEISRMVR